MALHNRAAGANKRAATENSARVVKSAVRVMSILEYFSEIRRPATVVEIANALGYPPSSAAALLRSLVALGYLHFRARGRSYLPSPRLPLIGAWMHSPFFCEGSLLSLVRGLHSETSETAFIAMPNGRDIQFIHVVSRRECDASHIRLGYGQPLVSCAAGHVAMSSMQESEIVRLAMWYDAKTRGDGPCVGHSALLNRMREVRRTRIAYAPDLRRPHITCVAARLPENEEQPQLVVGLVGASERFDAARGRLIATLRNSVEAYLGHTGSNILEFPRFMDNRPLHRGFGKDRGATAVASVKSLS